MNAECRIQSSEFRMPPSEEGGMRDEKEKGEAAPIILNS
jgi:hypothetical protein